MSAIKDGGKYLIRNYASVNSVKALNVINNGSIGNGTNVVMWDIDGSREQTWVANEISRGRFKLASELNPLYVLDRHRVTNNADVWKDTISENAAQIVVLEYVSSNVYRIKLAAENLYLAAVDDNNGSSSGTSTTSPGNVYWSSSKTSNRTKWIVEEVEDHTSIDTHRPPSESIYTVTASNGARLNVYAGKDANGTKLCIWEPDGSIDQEFKIVNYPRYSIIHAMCSSNGTGRVIDAYRPSGDVQSGTKAQIWNNNDPVSQEMVISYKGNGLYKIALKSNNLLCLTAAGTADNSAVTFSTYTAAAGQLWSFEEIDLSSGNDAHSPAEEGIYNLVSATGAYLNVYAGGTANGTRVCMWSGDNSIEQRFKLENSASFSQFFPMCSPQRVLDAYRPSGAVQAGAKVQIWDNNDTVSQQMIVTPKGFGRYKIALKSNPTLALTAASSADNANVTFNRFSGALNQLWVFKKIEFTDSNVHNPPQEGVYNITNKGNNLKLNIYAGQNANGARAVLWDGDGSVEQKFRLYNTLAGSKLHAMCSSGGIDKVLDAYRPEGDVQDGAKAQIWTANDDVAQLLMIAPTENGFYKIALQSNTALALTAPAAGSGAQATFTSFVGADNQLWKLDRLGDWVEPVFTENIERRTTSNFTPGRNGTTAKAWVCHIAEGTLEGTIAWEQNPDSNVSSHFIIGKTGRIVQMVSVSDTAWCNGTSNDPSNNRYWGKATAPIVAENAAKGHFNANEYTISIEFEGIYAQTKGMITNAQLEAAAWLMAYYKKFNGCTIPLDRDHIIGHYQITPITKPNCPGQLFPFVQLINRANELDPQLIPTLPPDPVKENPYTGVLDIDPNKLYYIRNTNTEWYTNGMYKYTQSHYLTVYSEGDNPDDPTDNSYYDKNNVGQPIIMDDEYSKMTANFICADVKLYCDNVSLKEGNIRQLFRISGNRLYLACSNLGHGKVASILGSGVDSGIIAMSSYNTSSASQQFEVLPVEGSEHYAKLKLNGQYINVINYKDPEVVDNNSIRRPFNARIELSSSFDEQSGRWFFVEYTGDKPDSLDDMSSAKYSTVKHPRQDKDRTYIVNTAMPAGCGYDDVDLIEYFHPFSGMVKGSWSENSVKINNILRNFYCTVFSQTTAAQSKYLINLYGARTNLIGTIHHETLHYGVDISLTEYAPIYSAHSGFVNWIDESYGVVGIYDVLKDVTYVYMHMYFKDQSEKSMPEMPLTIGDKVSIGTLLGLQGTMAGKKDGVQPHLHFEVRKGYRTDAVEAPVKPTHIPLESIFPYPYMQ